MAEVLHFKGYLMEESNDESKGLIQIETRKFTMKKDNVPSFQQFYERISNVFPTLHNMTFTITWKDYDEDMITISSDEELKIFFFENKLIRKLYLTIKKENKQSDSCQGSQTSSKLQDIVHSKIICDACENTVHGFRYKCLMCPDFDLCSACEAQGFHPEHYMIRTAYPVSWNHRCMPRFSRRFLRHMKKSAKARDEEKETRHFSQRSSDEEQSSWVENLVQILSDWANIPSEEPAKDNAPANTEKAAPKNTKSPSSVLNDLRQSPLCDNVLYKMQNIIDNSLQFLDPLGVDVAISVQPESVVETTEKSQSPKKEKNPNPMESEKTFEETSAEKQKDENVNLNMGSPVKMNEKTVAEQSNVTVQNVKREDKEEGCTKVTEKMDEKIIPNRSNAEIEGWTLLNANDNNNSSVSEVAVEKATSTSAESSQTTLYPPLPQNQDTFYHPDPHIQCAVQTMKEMGFTNERGWLTQLLISKGGDISKALDVVCSMRN